MNTYEGGAMKHVINVTIDLRPIVSLTDKAKFILAECREKSAVQLAVGLTRAYGHAGVYDTYMVLGNWRKGFQLTIMNSLERDGVITMDIGFGRFSMTRHYAYKGTDKTHTCAGNCGGKWHST